MAYATVCGVHLDTADVVIVPFAADHPAVATGHGVAEAADAVVQYSPPAAKLLSRRGHGEPQTASFAAALVAALVAVDLPHSWVTDPDHDANKDRAGETESPNVLSTSDQPKV